MAKKKKASKKASTRAGKYVKEEIDEIRSGAHGAKNAKQAIAIGLSKARRAGVPVKDSPNARAKSSKTKKKSARRKTKTSPRTSAKRSKAATRALKKQPKRAASHRASSRQAKAGARKRKSKTGR